MGACNGFFPMTNREVPCREIYRARDALPGARPGDLGAGAGDGARAYHQIDARSSAGTLYAAGPYLVGARGARREPLLGKVVGVGFVDEITDRHYVIIDGADARVHYVELGRLNPDNLPSRDNIVRITADSLNGKPQSTPRLQIPSRDFLTGSGSLRRPGLARSARPHRRLGIAINAWLWCGA